MHELKQAIHSQINSIVSKYTAYKKKRTINNTKIKQIILLIALLLLLVGIYFSISDNPQVLDNIRWQWIWMIFLIGVPVTVILNALEFYISALMISVHVSITKALEVTIIGSAANMLPLPGSTMVRVAALKMSGAGYKKSTLVTLLIAFVWIGVAFLFAGLMLSFYPDNILGYFFIAIGASTLIFTAVVSRYLSIQVAKFINLLFIKCAMVLVDAIRIYWCFKAIDIAVHFSQASTFVISGVLGSAVSIVPAGLGVREYVSAGIAPIIGIAASAGFLTATLNRLVGLCSLLPVAGFMALRLRKN